MSLDRVMLIRHAEKPEPGGALGVDESGNTDPDSLIPQGWQRAGALVRFFYPRQAFGAGSISRPDVVFAAGVGPGSKSKRSLQTVSPLAALLGTEQAVPFEIGHLKDDIDAMVADISQREGTVLIAWEHKLIASIVNCISAGQLSPQPWPDERFDMVWVLERNGGGWAFSQVPQLLLPDDRAQGE